MDIINIVVAVSSILVPAAAYIVTTMVITKRNSIDIRELAVEIKSIDTKFSAALSEGLKSLDDKIEGSIKTLDDKFSGSIKALDDKFSGAIKSLDDKFTVSIKALDDKFTEQLSTVKADVAVIKAICQERSRSDKAEQTPRP
ncbi:hypothetical protein FACS1894102_6420 [Spirochaetia bacterium]|nr:hypothetical protein FACS1894102_6420 [Spirochaetia bacterium]